MQRFELKSFLTGKCARSARWDLSSSYAELWDLDELMSLVPGSHDELTMAPLSCPELHGSSRLRECIAAYVNCGLTSDDVIVTNGADDAISLLLLSTVSPGDKVVIQTPSYPTNATLVRWRGAEVIEWSCNEENDWVPCCGQLAELCSENVKMIMFASPHNPSGWKANRNDFEAFVDVAEKWGTLVVCDEVYAGLNHDGSPHDSILSTNGKVAAIGGLSKSFGLPGIRIGWIASKQRALLKNVRMLRDYMNSYVSTLADVVAVWALSNHSTLLERNRQFATQNKAALQAFVDRQKNVFSGAIPDTSVLQFLRWNGAPNAGKLSRRLLANHGTILVSSDFFGMPPDYVRLGFGKRDFPMALSAFEHVLHGMQLATSEEVGGQP